MSWLIDTKAISRVLKEAQKQIDKALDIKDDEEGGESSVTSPTREQTDEGNYSQSLEVLSDATAPDSDPYSPVSLRSDSQADFQSESVEVLSGLDTSMGISQIEYSEEASPVSIESIEVLGSSLMASPNTEHPSELASNDSEGQLTVRPVITTAPSLTGLRLSLKPMDEQAESKMNESNESSKTVKAYTNIEMFEVQSNSDLTASFEEILPSVKSREYPSKMKVEGDSKPESADEVETGTSSDIEIISCPSTTNSAYRESPQKQSVSVSAAKRDTKGHTRGPSEISIQSTNSEDSHLSTHSETEKLLKRLMELSETLEQRESKLVEMSRRNVELEEQVRELKNKIQSDDSLETAEECTQRMLTLEKKFQQTIREKEAFRKELLVLKQDLTSKISHSEVEKQLGERDETIADLRTEGEKLSKQILNYTNIIKKLRAKEKESDERLKSQGKKIEELSEETERLKKSFTAKEDVERSQIEAVHKLSFEKKKLEEENSKLRSQNGELTQALEALRESSAGFQQELKVLRESKAELETKLAGISDLESQHAEVSTQNEHMTSVIAEIKNKWKLNEEQKATAMSQLRDENHSLLSQLEESEARLQSLTVAYSSATTPLTRQIESLREQLKARDATFEKTERELLQKLDECQDHVQQLKIAEATLKEQMGVLRGQNRELEVELARAQESLRVALETSRRQEGELARHEGALREEKCNNEELVGQLREKIAKLEARISDGEEKMRKVHDAYTEKAAEAKKNLSSPASSLDDHLSVGETSLWQQEDFDGMSQSGHALEYNSTVLHNTSFLESLQGTIKQKDSEISQLQWELFKLKKERDILSEEVCNLSVEVEALKENVNKTDAAATEFSELQEKYNAMLTLYGEKIEETEELKLDLMEVKEMYKSQIDELLRLKAKPN